MTPRSSFLGKLAWVGIGILAAMPLLPAFAAERAVKLTTDFGFLGTHSFFYVAIDKGYYKDEGLSVEILPGRGSTTTVQEVAANVVDFGFADASSLILARGTEHVPVKIVAVVADGPQCIVSLADSNISKPKDLEGRTVADTFTGPMYQFFPAYARRAGIDAAKVKWINITSNATITMMLAGQVDAIGHLSLDLPTVQRVAGDRKLNILYYKDVGLALYSSSIVASEATIKNDPNLVRSFVRATERGLREAFADPGSAGKIMNKYNHQIEPAMASQAMVLLRDMVMTPLGKEKGLGYIDPKRMKDTVAIVAEASPRMGPVDYHDVFAAGFAAPLPQ